MVLTKDWLPGVLETFERPNENTVQTSRNLSLAEVEEPLRIVVVYEDTAAHVRARHIHDYLVSHLESELQLEFSWWSFDQLQETSHADTSARATAAADLVIFSARPGDEWRPAVNSWVASWTRQRAGRPGAVAVIFSPPATGGPNIPCGRQITLQTVASGAGMDFLPQQAERLPSPTFAQGKFIEHVAPLAPMIQDFSHRPDSSPYWGING